MASNYHDTDLLDEPSLDELFAEPMVQLFMQRDGIEASSMRGEFDRMSRLYEGRAPA